MKREEKLAAALDEQSGELTAVAHLAAQGEGAAVFFIFLLLARILSTKLTICAEDIEFCILNAERQL